MIKANPSPKGNGFAFNLFGEPKKLTAFCGQFFYFRSVWFGQPTRRSIFVQQKAHEGVAALRNSTVCCFSDSNGHLPREFELDTGTGNGFFYLVRMLKLLKKSVKYAIMELVAEQTKLNQKRQRSLDLPRL